MHDTGNDDAGAEGNTLREFAKYFSVDHVVGLGTGFVCEPWFDRAVAFWEKQREKR